MRRFDRYRSDAVYNTRAVVLRTGVPADTLRAWERRYGVPSPPRTQGNQRLYSERDIAMIIWLRDQTRQGLTISQAIALLQVESTTEPPRQLNAEDAEFLGRRGSQSPRVADAHAGNDRLRDYRDRLITALASFDTGAADRVVEEAIALVPVDDVCRYVLGAAMIEIGERWQHGDVRVGVEHFSSSFVMRKLASLFNLSQPQHGRGPIVAATVEGELHELGLLLTCLYLSRHGFNIVYLGPNLPLDELLVVIDDLQPPLVLLSASTEQTLSTLITFAQVIRAHGDRLPLAVPTTVVGFGGRIFLDQPELRALVDGVFLGEGRQEIVDCVDQILAVNTISWIR